MKRFTQRGATLVEIVTTLAIVALAALQSVAGFGDTLERRRVEGLAAELATDLQFVRSETVRRQTGVRISFGVDDSGRSCYLIHTGAADACGCGDGGVAHCSAEAALIKAVHAPRVGGAQFDANTDSMLYDPARGTTTPAASIAIALADGRSVRHVVNILGRVRTCSPDAGLAGYKPC